MARGEQLKFREPWNEVAEYHRTDPLGARELEKLASGDLSQGEIRQITFGEPRTEDPDLTTLWKAIRDDLSEQKLSGDRMIRFAENAGRWSEKTLEDLTNAAMKYEQREEEDQSVDAYLRAIQAIVTDGIATVTERSEHLPFTTGGFESSSEMMDWKRDIDRNIWDAWNSGNYRDIPAILERSAALATTGGKMPRKDH